MSVNNKYLSNEQMTAKLSEQGKELEHVKRQLLFEKSKASNSMKRINKRTKQLQNYAKTGSMKNICKNLIEVE